MTKTKLNKTNFDFEATLAELNTIVEQIERGGLTLEASLQNFERGISLVRGCQTALKTAEQKVQILTEKNDETQLTTFANDESES